jgi:outer membrane lipoprotein-sorting protein
MERRQPETGRRPGGTCFEKSLWVVSAPRPAHTFSEGYRFMTTGWKAFVNAALVLPLAGAWIGAAAGPSWPAEPDLQRIVSDIDELYRAQSSYSQVEMEIVTPHWSRTLSMNVWTEGLKKTFIRITEPKKEQGVATLRIGDEMWNYLPKTNKVIKVPPSMMMSSWMGSDFTNDDLVKEYTFFKDYTYSIVDVDDPDSSLVYIKCVPKEGRPIVWDHVTIAARRADHLPVWFKYYGEKDELMRVLEYSDVTEFGNRRLPATLTMIPKHEKGKTTRVTYKKLEFNANVGEDTFSLRNLRSQG